MPVDRPDRIAGYSLELMASAERRCKPAGVAGPLIVDRRKLVQQSATNLLGVIVCPAPAENALRRGSCKAAQRSTGIFEGIGRGCVRHLPLPLQLRRK